MRKSKGLVCASVCVFMLSGVFASCGTNEELVDTQTDVQYLEDNGIEIENESLEDEVILTFVDAHGESHTCTLQQNWKMHPYDISSFAMQDGRMSYSSDEYTYRLGVDVSKFQGDIDWQAVANDGISFAYVRIGFRGYGEEGALKEDPYGISNVKGAIDAGLDVGIYFFSQAINEAEAVEEAEYAMSMLSEAGVTPEQLTMGIVFDPETILGDDARTDDVSGEQFTKNTIAFIERVREEGYDGLIYCNMMWEAYTLDLAALEEYSLWYADYEMTPQTPYMFDIWQYTESGNVNGIDGGVDIDIQLISNN